MNKLELATKLSKKQGISLAHADRSISILLEIITDSLAANEPVKLVGFGTFKVRHRKARPGHNPQTRQKLILPARNFAKFLPGQALKDRVEASPDVQS